MELGLFVIGCVVVFGLVWSIRTSGRAGQDAHAGHAHGAGHHGAGHH